MRGKDKDADGILICYFRYVQISNTRMVWLLVYGRSDLIIDGSTVDTVCGLKNARGWNGKSQR